MMEPKFEDWILVQAMVGQAMLGSVSTNVREIRLSYKEDGWLIKAILERPSAQDIEDIQDIADETSIMFVDLDAEDRISSVANTRVST